MYVYGKNRADAARKLRLLRQQVEQDGQPGTDKRTTGDYLQEWYHHCIEDKCSSSTARIYRDQIERYVIPGIGNVKLHKLTSGRIQQWVNELQKQPHLSPRSVEIAFGVLRKSLNHAVATGFIPRNPTQHVTLPPVVPYEAHVLSEEDARQLLQTAAGDRLEALYYLLFLALRRSEVLALRWDDVDVEKQQLIIRKGKTRASRRTIPLPAFVVQKLREHRKNQQDEQAIFGVEWNPERLVFPTRVGTQIRGRNFIRHFKAMLRKAGLSSAIRVHDVRHSSASLMLAQGVPIKEVQELLGHATVHTTLRIYAHVIGEGKRAAVTKLSDTLMVEIQDA
jgi:integrase